MTSTPSPLIFCARRIEPEQLNLGDEATYIEIIWRSRAAERGRGRCAQPRRVRGDVLEVRTG